MKMKKIGITFVNDFVVRKYEFRGQRSVNSKNRGLLQKTEGRTILILAK